MFVALIAHRMFIFNSQWASGFYWNLSLKVDGKIKIGLSKIEMPKICPSVKQHQLADCFDDSRGPAEDEPAAADMIQILVC